MRRRLHLAARLSIDLAALSLALWVAWLVRLEGRLELQVFKRAVFVWPWVVGLQYACLSLFEVPRFAWSHVGLREARKIGEALGVALILLCGVRLGAGLLRGYVPHLVYLVIPYGVLLIDVVLATSLVLGVRVLRRVQVEEGRAQRAGAQGAPSPVLLVGAGYAGALLVRELRSRGDLGRRPLGFLDDDPLKQGHLVEGVPVLGPLEALAEVVAGQGAVAEVLISAPSMPGERVRLVREGAQRLGLPVKTIPGLYEIVSGAASVGQLRDVAIEDLLRREPVRLDVGSIEALTRGAVVLVTGAGGSIGSELCRQVARFGARRLVLVERAENALFEVHAELRRTTSCELAPCLVDVTSPRLAQVFAAERPQVVLHAAAHKHVPLMEGAPCEAVLNNLGGTANVARLAEEAGVEVFVLVSTDKAVRPSSIMGAAKRAAERWVSARAGGGAQTRFVTVRFGNVLGSSGSVVPIFRAQIARGGPVTVTDPEMTRYFMTIPEASQLILQAAALGTRGDIFVLDMGQPVRILDLARDLIELSGFTAEQIPIVFSGRRPGEKLHEELHGAAEQVERLPEHAQILVVRQEGSTSEGVQGALEALLGLAQAGDDDAVRARLAELADYAPAAGPLAESMTPSA
ncbi:MAG: polysaccharide biosynthesis protein [Planctomycetota bacterium]